MRATCAKQSKCRCSFVCGHEDLLHKKRYFEGFLVFCHSPKRAVRRGRGVAGNVQGNAIFATTLVNLQFSIIQLSLAISISGSVVLDMS